MLQGDFMVCLSIFHDYQANVEEFLSTVLDSTKTSCSELGQLEAPAVACTEMWFHDLLGQRIWAKLEAITNLLKSDAYRKFTWSYPGRIRKDHEKTIFFELVEGKNSGNTCRHFEKFRSLHCSRNLGPHFQEQIRGLCSENDRNKTWTCPKSAQDTTKGSTITTLVQASCRQWVRQLWVTATTSHSHSMAGEYFEVHLCDLGAVT